MKKLMSMLLAAAMMLSLVACGGGEKPAASAPAVNADGTCTTDIDDTHLTSFKEIICS